MRKLLFINRSYWPDAEATGQLLTELCEDLAKDFEVSVICGQPNSNPSNATFKKVGHEVHNGVHIHRLRHTRFNKGKFIGRMANLLSFALAARTQAKKLRPQDVVITETDPFLLPMLGAELKSHTACRFVSYLQDIYPDIAIELGVARDSTFTRVIRRKLYEAYTHADAIVVLGQDMRRRIESWPEQLQSHFANNKDSDEAETLDEITGAKITKVKVKRKSGATPEFCSSQLGPFHIIPNWTDVTQIWPQKEANPFRQQQQLDGKFVVMYSGNLGASQRLESLLSVAKEFLPNTDIEFVLIGEGSAKASLQEIASKEKLTNTRFLPYQPKDKLTESLSAADLHVVSMDERIVGCLVPSKLYGILASGTPVLAMVPNETDVAHLVAQQQLGWVIPPGATNVLSESIQSAFENRATTSAIGKRCRDYAEANCTRAKSVESFQSLFRELCVQ